MLPKIPTRSYFPLPLQRFKEKNDKGRCHIQRKNPCTGFALHRTFIVIPGYNPVVTFPEKEPPAQQGNNAALDNG